MIKYIKKFEKLIVFQYFDVETVTLLFHNVQTKKLKNYLLQKINLFILFLV